MSVVGQKWLSKSASWGLATRCAILVAAILLIAIPMSLVQYQQFGLMGLAATAVAVGVCLFGSGVALVVTVLARSPNAALQGLLFSMLMRMGFPFMTGLLLQQRGGPLAEARVFGCILIVYLVTLAVETLLVTPLVQARTAADVKPELKEAS